MHLQKKKLFASTIWQWRVDIVDSKRLKQCTPLINS